MKMGLYITLKREAEQDKIKINVDTLLKTYHNILNCLIKNSLFSPTVIILWNDAPGFGQKILEREFSESTLKTCLSEFKEIFRVTIKKIDSEIIDIEERGLSLEITGVLQVNPPPQKTQINKEKEIFSYLTASWDTELEEEVGDIHFDSYSFFDLDFPDFFKDKENLQVKENITKLNKIWNEIIEINTDIDRMILGEGPNSNIFMLGTAWGYYSDPSRVIEDVHTLIRRSDEIAEAETTYIFNELKIVEMNNSVKAIIASSEAYRSKEIIKYLKENEGIVSTFGQLAKRYGMTVNTANSVNLLSDSFDPELVATVINSFTKLISDIYRRALEPPNLIRKKLRESVRKTLSEYEISSPTQLDRYLPLEKK